MRPKKMNFINPFHPVILEYVNVNPVRQKSSPYSSSTWIISYSQIAVITIRPGCGDCGKVKKFSILSFQPLRTLAQNQVSTFNLLAMVLDLNANQSLAVRHSSKNFRFRPLFTYAYFPSKEKVAVHTHTTIKGKKSTVCRYVPRIKGLV